jgi:hypothetical protein
VSASGKLGWLVVSVGLIVAAAGCTALVDTDEESLGGVPMACEPGQISTCACPGGVTGTQACNAGGAYDDCLCEVGAAGNSGSR